MVYFLNTKKKFFLLICLISFANQKNISFDLQSNITDYALDPLSLKYLDICKIWIPSLLNPILVGQKSYTNIEDTLHDYIGDIDLINIFFDGYKCGLYKFKKSDESFNIYLGLIYKLYNGYRQCYFGLSPSIPNSTIGLEKEEYNLALLKKNNEIENQIISFEKWEITDNLISSKLYLGVSHEHFKSNEGIIGTCKMSDEEYWGCSFQQMIFNNVVIPLTKDDGSLYPIYFSSESNDIIFPNQFRNIFREASNGKCAVRMYDVNDYLDCAGLNEDYIPLTLSNEDMNIKVEIDYYYKFCKAKDIQKYKTRIKFRIFENIILPLMMFKRFHIEFDAENKTISFYTQNSSILEIIPKKPVEQPSSFSVLHVLLIIFIVLFIIVIAFVVFLCIRKRRNSNKSSDKFENGEDFKQMDERLFN